MASVGITEYVKADNRKFEIWYNAREEVYIVQVMFSFLDHLKSFAWGSPLLFVMRIVEGSIENVMTATHGGILYWYLVTWQEKLSSCFLFSGLCIY